MSDTCKAHKRMAQGKEEKRITNIEQGISNVEGKEEKRMKKERKKMNIERWYAEGAVSPPPQAFICPKGAFLRHSMFLVHYSIFPPLAAPFSSAVLKKT